MDELLDIEELTVKYQEKKVLDNLCLLLNTNTWYTLIGPNGSGKTTLIKAITALLPFEGKIEFSFLDLNQKNVSEIRSKMAVLFDNIDDQIVEDNVYDEITFELKNMNCSKKEIDSFIDNIDKITNIKRIIDAEITELTNEEKHLVVLTSALIIKPKLLIIDETFSKLSNKEREFIYNIILNYKQKYNLSVLNITHNLEDSLIGDNIILMDEGKIIFNETLEKTYNENLLDPNKYKLPFIVELCNALKLYELIDKNYYTTEELIGELWK